MYIIIRSMEIRLSIAQARKSDQTVRTRTLLSVRRLVDMIGLTVGCKALNGNFTIVYCVYKEYTRTNREDSRFEIRDSLAAVSCVQRGSICRMFYTFLC